MFANWRRQRRRNREIVEDLYGALIARARRPYLFENCGIEDTVMGRFEAVTLEIYLFMRRCRGDAELAPIVQDIVDRFVVDMDDSLRQIGIGDQSVPKRMRKLTGQFYERVNAYDRALDDAAPKEALAEVLRGRVLSKDVDEAVAARLAGEAMAELAALSDSPASDLLSGQLDKSGTP
ncbi:ubiquinol-cytochrome C chaperone family protein [Fulvimarina sp. MAC3]|uniref:ubiquinol-cytochrome C chaperone family protein n=1 Tax=Fulvimarina sp. MAC3 TaxID=3148887 RepID=UPI0031FCE197